MEINEFQKASSRTMSKLSSPIEDDIHMVLGMQTECAEIADVYKKHLAYKKELDLINIKEELGDLLFYIVNLCNLHEWDVRDILQTNVDKLKLRYPDKFDSDKAINRDLDAERRLLSEKL